jgi:O-antigen ligase
VPEYIKALIVILGIALPTFWMFRKQACGSSISEEDFDRRRNLWIGITLSSFLAHNFWIHTAISGLMILYAGRKDKNSMALFFFVLFAVPPIAVTIPGIGGIQQIFSVSHTRILAILILIPAYLRLRRQADTEAFGKNITDKLLIGYIFLPLLLQLTVDSWTNTIRFGLYSFTDVFLPYYVASRGIKSLKEWKDTIMSLMTAIAVLSTIAIFESTRKWLLYGSVAPQLGIDWDFGSFMVRSESLRAMATSGHAIVLGYILMIGLAFLVTTRKLSQSGRFQLALAAVMILGLLGTAARGPWVGALAVLMVLLLTGTNRLTRFTQLTVTAGIGFAFLSITTWGSEFLSYLPFVGNSQTESVIYRQLLFDVSLQVIKLNPLLGSFDYMRNPLMQQLIQGEGIIDLVNSYLGIALTYGVIGLCIFSGVFFSGGYKVWKSMKLISNDQVLNAFGRSLLAALAGILITIATASSVTYIALLYWIIAGLCVGYAKLVSNNPQTELSYSKTSEVNRPLNFGYRS